MDRKRAQRLPGGLYALVDDGLVPAGSLVEVASGVLSGARVVQLRLERTGDREALLVVREVVRRCEAAGSLCIVNDRVDLCLMAAAHGVHVGDEDIPPAEARRILGPGAVIGVTARSLEDAVRAHEAKADYVGLGPIFPTSTKRVNAQLLGLKGLSRIAAKSPLPVAAISGIGLDNIEEVAASGAHLAAVASDLLRGADVAGRARALADRFEQGAARYRG